MIPKIPTKFPVTMWKHKTIDKSTFCKIALTVFFIATLSSNAQNIALIPNPDAHPETSNLLGSGIEYNNNYYFGYVDVGFKSRLAKYDGTTITLPAANPDAGSFFF